jgi:flavin reductase (DIM6/NTAB) family NADH-FMN oxidoreductase RutF
MGVHPAVPMPEQAARDRFLAGMSHAAATVTVVTTDGGAGRIRTADGDKFSCGAWRTMTTGAPRLVDPLVAFDCRLTRADLVGTHYVLFGEVAEIFLSEGAPLIYQSRAYGTPAPIAGREDR